MCENSSCACKMPPIKIINGWIEYPILVQETILTEEGLTIKDRWEYPSDSEECRYISIINLVAKRGF